MGGSPYREGRGEAGDEGGVGAAGGEAVALAERLQLPPLHRLEVHLHPSSSSSSSPLPPPPPPEISTVWRDRRPSAAPGFAKFWNSPRVFFFCGLLLWRLRFELLGGRVL